MPRNRVASHSNVDLEEGIEDDWTFQSSIPMDYPEPTYSAAHLYYDKFNICCALAISCLAMDVFHLICLFYLYYYIDNILFKMYVLMMIFGGICLGIPCLMIKVQSTSDALIYVKCNKIMSYLWVLIKVIVLQILAFTWIPIILYKIINVSVAEWLKRKKNDQQSLHKTILQICCINAIVCDYIEPCDKNKFDEELEQYLYETVVTHFQYISLHDIKKLNHKSTIFGRIYYILIHWNFSKNYKIIEGELCFGAIKYILFMLYFVCKCINMFFAIFGVLYLYIFDKMENVQLIMVWGFEMLLLSICSYILWKMWKEQISYYLYITPSVHKIDISHKIFNEIKTYFAVIYSQSMIMDRFGNDISGLIWKYCYTEKEKEEIAYDDTHDSNGYTEEYGEYSTTENRTISMS